MYLIRRREDGQWWQCYDALGGGDFWARWEVQGRTFASAAEAEEEVRWLTDAVDLIERPDARPVALHAGRPAPVPGGPQLALF